ncbi:MAG: ATP-binding protein [Desulfuromonadales bacterium]|nr:ATP-binding protein [Desulfuromonadales bacterium]MDW7758930.1 ATP-binding protein [Desulfuromonadales bacterium]
MHQDDAKSKTYAPLTNVGLFMAMAERVINRGPGLPGLALFHGPSGWGKSSAACYAYGRLDAYYIVCRSTMSKKSFFAELLKEMGLMAERTIDAMFMQASAELQSTGRPIIIDEMDYLVDKGAVDIVRDLSEDSGCAIIMIGEEKMPDKLKRWERFSGRVLATEGAQKVSLQDVAHLARFYAEGVTVGQDLLDKIHHLSAGSARRVCVNLSNIRAEARRLGLDEMDLDQWGTRPLYTGDSARRRLV